MPPYLTDGLSHPPPTTGPYAYYPPHGAFRPNDASFPGLAETYVDPVFGGTVRRITDDWPNASARDNYSKNGLFNADGTYYVVYMADLTVQAVHTVTGALKLLTETNYPYHSDAACDPVDPDIFYFCTTKMLKKQLISTGVVSTVRDFTTELAGGNIGSLGGTIDWMDATGRYVVINLGATAYRLWDKQTDTLYSGTITDAIDAGYCGITPDAKWIILVNGLPKKRYAINHGGQSIATTGTTFFNSGGDHGDVISASDGNSYFVRVDADGANPFAQSVRVEDGATTVLYNMDYAFTNNGHISGVGRGSFRDWAVIAHEATNAAGSPGGDEAFDAADPTASWVPYRSELVMSNVLTGEIRRLVHHRSRQLNSGYNCFPRVTVDWDGTKIAWASNMGHDAVADYADTYVIDVPQDDVGGGFLRVRR